MLALAILFVLRVLGQLFALVAAPSWWPHFDRWHSGYMPYPLLLGFQVLIAVLLVRSSLRLGRAIEPFEGRTAGRVAAFAALYAVGMAVRYAVTMAYWPDERWTGPLIPILFHWVLALWLRVAAARPHQPGSSAAARQASTSRSAEWSHE